MQETEDEPLFQFLRATPSDLKDNPPLASSLQAFETSLLLLTLGRYPSALVSIGSALESALKAKLRIPPDKWIYLWQMLNDLRPLPDSLEHFAPKGQKTSKQKRFSDMRNHIVHYGFTPRDDETCVVELLETGFPFLCRVYEEYFDYFLDWKDIRHDARDFFALSEGEMSKAGLQPVYADHLRTAIQVYRDGLRLELPSRLYCIRPLTCLIGHRLVMDRTAPSGGSVSVDFRKAAEQDERREDIKHKLGDLNWEFNCPACFETLTALFAFDESRLDAGVIAPTRGACVECRFWVETDEPFLADRLLADQILEHRQAILEAFTDVAPDDPEGDEE
jgi:hypothetical protein